MKNIKKKKSSVRNALHLSAQLTFRGQVNKDKSKVIPRKQKNNRIDY